MRSWNEPKTHRARIEIIPMIDVMMFLLVFFVLVSLNVIPATGVKTNLPSASSASKNADQKVAVITLGKEGELQLDGQNATPESLIAGLTRLRREHAKLTVVVKGDAETPLQKLLDVMDLLKQGGFEAMSIAAKQR